MVVCELSCGRMQEWTFGLMVVSVRSVRTRMSVAVYDSAGGGKDWRGRATRWRGIARTSPAVTAETLSVSVPAKALAGSSRAGGLSECHVPRLNLQSTDDQ